MLKYGWYALGALLAFGLLLAALPEGTVSRAGTGVTLHDVKLRLYPALEQGANAEWHFAAARITYDPSTGETRVARPDRGERLVDGKVDTTIRTQELTIDPSNNLRTITAELYIPSQCVRVQLRGTTANPIRIDQATGFRAERARVVYPDVVYAMRDMQADFALKNVQAADSSLVANLDSTETCVNGRIVPRR